MLIYRLGPMLRQVRRTGRLGGRRRLIKSQGRIAACTLLIGKALLPKRVCKNKNENQTTRCDPVLPSLPLAFPPFYSASLGAARTLQTSQDRFSDSIDVPNGQASSDTVVKHPRLFSIISIFFSNNIIWLFGAAIFRDDRPPTSCAQGYWPNVKFSTAEAARVRDVKHF